MASVASSKVQGTSVAKKKKNGIYLTAVEINIDWLARLLECIAQQQLRQRGLANIIWSNNEHLSSRDQEENKHKPSTGSISPSLVRPSMIPQHLQDVCACYPRPLSIVLGSHHAALLQGQMGVEVADHGRLVCNVLDTARPLQLELTSVPRKHGDLAPRKLIVNVLPKLRAKDLGGSCDELRKKRARQRGLSMDMTR